MQPFSYSKMKPGLWSGFFVCGLLALTASGCGDAPANSPGSAGRPVQRIDAGRLENKDIDEASGLAWSAREDDLLWTHNDSGDKARLYALGMHGEARGRIKLKNSDNRDWEDIASFTLDGEPYLLVADIGDNESRREYLTLYVIAEPDLASDSKVSLEPAWRINFTYPEGPRDAEAIAVDTERGLVLIITKRDLPARLYEVPLQPANDDIVLAKRGPDMRTLPQPQRNDVATAPMSKDWHWQPTAMDIAHDGEALIIMTYSAIYYFARADSPDWSQALQQSPLALQLNNLPNAEAAALSPDSQSILVTVEKKHAPLLRIDFKDRQ